MGLLPESQRVLARRLAGASSSSVDVASLDAIEEPLSRLLAAAVLLRAGQASPPVLDKAIQTASDQGWRRPLLAWLGLAAQRAEQAGNALEAARLRARMSLVAPAAPAAPVRSP